MEAQGVEKRRTLGGHPFQNGMVERANGKVKMLLAKLKEIRGGGWSDNLDAAVKSYNEQLNRTGGMAPTEAVALDKEAQKEYRDRIIANNNARSVDFMVRRPLEEGTRVRLKLAKSKLDKASVPSWSAQIFTIEKVVKHRTPTVAPYYVVKDRPSDLRYSRNDLLPIEGTPQEIPKPPPVRETRAMRAQNEIDEGAFTRARNRAAADALQAKRTTRSDSAAPAEAPPKAPPAKKKVAKARFKKGDLVRVKYPEGMFDGVVRSSTAKRTVIYFEADKTEDTFLPKEYNSIEMR
jgi:nucleoid-associated protein YgaU